MSARRPAWARLLVARGAQAVAVALAVGTACFLIARALPGDLAMRIAASRYGYDFVGTAAAETVRAELGLDGPAWAALLRWFGDLASFGLGTSLVTGEPVWDEVTHQLGATLRLSAAAVAIGVLLGAPLGVRAGLRPDGWADRSTLVLAAALRATPPFLLAVLLMMVASVWLGALPAAGEHDGGLLLPAATLGLGLAAGLARVVRAAVRAALASPSHEFLRTCGLTDAQALRHHALRHAAVPVLAWLGVQTVFLVEGAVVVETLFAWPGIGHALVHAVFGRDVPMIQGTALCMGLLFVVFNFAIDSACLWADPRRRAGAPR